MTKLEFIQHDTGDQVDACIIWLHGLGADGSDFLPIVEQMRLPARLQARFIFPHAPVRPITINQGYRMPGWYDITSLDIVEHEDVTGIEASSAAIDVLIEQQQNSGIPAERIVLAGFSQGGVIALHCGLKPRDSQLGGVMALSCYLPVCAQLVARHDIALFLAHGLRDPVVACEHGLECRNRLERAGYRPEWHQYDMEHSVCMDEIYDIRSWLLNCLNVPS